MKRSGRNALLAFAFALIVAIGIGLYYARALVSIGVAYKAKMLCSGVFVSDRSPESILNTDLAVDDLAALRHIDAQVDRNAQIVAASLLGLISQKAVYRPGLGCTLTFDGVRANSPALAETGPQQAGPAWLRPLGLLSTRPNRC